MKKTIAMVTVLLLGVGFLGTSLAVQRGGGHGPRGSGGRGGGINIPSERMLRRILDLTDEQNEKVNLLREAARASVEPLVEERRERREQLKAALDVDTPDPLRVGELVVASRAGREKMRVISESNRDSFRAILTEKQIAKLEKMKDRHGSRRGVRRSRRERDEDGF